MQTAAFTLHANSDGIHPATENVHIKLGNFSITIPAGKFVQEGSMYAYDGTVDQISLKARIHVPEHAHPMDTAKGWPAPAEYWFELQAKHVDLRGIVLPPALQFSIGDDSGQSELHHGQAKFDGKTTSRH